MRNTKSQNEVLNKIKKKKSHLGILDRTAKKQRKKSQQKPQENTC